MPSFGEMVAAKRSERGMTQGDLGRKVGVHWVTISKLERGEIRMTEDWLKRFAEAFYIDVSEFLASGATETQSLEPWSAEEEEKVASYYRSPKRPTREKVTPTGALRFFAEHAQQAPRLQQELESDERGTFWEDIPVVIGDEIR